MSNPIFRAPLVDYNDATTYKANIDASIAGVTPICVNLGITYSAGTFTIHGAEGTALSTPSETNGNPGFIRFQDKTTPGLVKYISVNANQNFIDDAGASEIIGNLFGFPTGVAVTTDQDFYIYAVSNDAMNAVAFMISRLSGCKVSPAAAKIGAPDDPVADTIDCFFAFDNLDETLYDANPAVCIGKIRMRMSTSDDWTVQALSNLDGIGSCNPLDSAIKMETTYGQVTKPLQSAFSAYVSGNISSVTGDGTAYTVIFNTKYADQGINYNTSTGIFTAPVAGLYLLNTVLYIRDTSTRDTLVGIVCTAGTHWCYTGPGHPLASDGSMIINGSTFAVMAAGATAKVQITVSGGAKDVDIFQPLSEFSGTLIC
jgi:hypothetical protein